VTADILAAHLDADLEDTRIMRSHVRRNERGPDTPPPGPSGPTERPDGAPRYGIRQRWVRDFSEVGPHSC
jgi:hypothetical protein